MPPPPLFLKTYPDEDDVVQYITLSCACICCLCISARDTSCCFWGFGPVTIPFGFWDDPRFLATAPNPSTELWEGPWFCGCGFTGSVAFWDFSNGIGGGGSGLPWMPILGCVSGMWASRGPFLVSWVCSFLDSNDVRRNAPFVRIVGICYLPQNEYQEKIFQND